MNTFQRLLLAIILIEIPVQLDVSLDYQESIAAWGALGGVNVSVTTFCLALLYGIWLVQAAIRKAPIPGRLLRAIAPGTAYLILVVVSALVAYRLDLALFAIALLVQAFLVFLYLVCWVRTEEDVRFVVTMLLAGIAVESLAMIGLKFFFKHDVTVASVALTIDDHGRVGGTLGSPNSAASYLIMMLPLALGVLLGRWRLSLRLLALAAFGLGAVALILTLSRGGWIGAAAAIALMCLAAWAGGRLSLFLPAAILLGGLIVLVGFFQVISARLFGQDHGAAYARIPLMAMTLRIIEDHPLGGVGANNLAVAMQPYAQSADYRGGFVYVVHNGYFQVLAETGIGGLLAFLLFLLAAVRRGWRGWRARGWNLPPVALGATAGLLAEMLHMNVDTFNGRSQVQVLWLMAGLVLAIGLIEDDQQETAWEGLRC